MEETPIVQVKRTTRNTVGFYCEFCKAEHTHGAAAISGHRVAHCTNEDSPYKKTGYILRISEAVADKSE